MAFVFGSDYSNLYGNLLATQQADVNAQMGLAHLDRQDQAAEAQAAQQGFTQEMQLAQEARARRGEAAAASQFAQNLDLQKQELAWRKQNQLSPQMERDITDRFKAEMEDADAGTWDETTSSLPEPQKKVLQAHTNRVQASMLGQKSAFDQAAELLNQQTKLEHLIKNAVPDWRPWPSGSRQRVLADVPEWQEQLSNVQKAASAITPEIRQHLRMNEDGWYEPNFTLPWKTEGKGKARNKDATVDAEAKVMGGKGGVAEQSLQNARDALKRNPDARAAILKRLSDNGIDPSLL